LIDTAIQSLRLYIVSVIILKLHTTQPLVNNSISPSLFWPFLFASI